MYKNISLALLILTMTGCEYARQKEENRLEFDRLRMELMETKALVNKLQETSGGKLVHMVYLNLKPEANQEEIIKEIQKLNSIEEVQGLEVGVFENLDDQRALSQYQLIFQMNFKDPDAYANYQVHPVHLALKESLKLVLAAPPATYDYLKK